MHSKQIERFARCCRIFALATLLIVPVARADYEILVREDEAAPAPGGGEEGTFAGFTGQGSVSPVSGDLFFVATAEGFAPAPTIRGGIWSFPTGTSTLEVVARSEDPATGVVPAANFVSFAAPILPTGPVNALGDMAFLGATSTSLEGVWVGDATGLTLVALEDAAAAPVGGGATYRDLEPPVINDSGVLAFRARLQNGAVTSSDDWMILAGSPGGLSVVAREGSTAPGTPTGTIFASSFLDPLVDASGQVCFNARTQGPAPDFDFGSGIWAGPIGSVLALVKQGDAAPGLTGGTVFGFFDTEINKPSWTGSQLAFRSFVDDNGTPRSGIWAGTPGGLMLVAAEGLNAPGTSLPIKELIGNPVLSVSGHVAFRAKLDPSDPGVTTSTDDIICYGPLGSVEIILRAGDQAPGLDPGETVSSMFLGGEFEMAPDGRLAFTMSHTANFTPTIWIAKSDGSINLIAARDLSFDDQGETWTMESSTINFLNSGSVSFNIDKTGFNGSDGRPSPFGPNGEFIFTAELSSALAPTGDQTLLRFGESPPAVVVPSIEILTGVPGPNDVRILVESVVGQTYAVNRSVDLDQVDPWTVVQSGLAGTGGVLQIDDLNALAGDDAVYYQGETE